MISDVSDQDITMQSSTKGRRKRPRWMDVFWHQDFFPFNVLIFPNFSHIMQPIMKCNCYQCSKGWGISIKDQFNQIQVSKHRQVVNCSLFKYDELISEKLT